MPTKTIRTTATINTAGDPYPASVHNRQTHTRGGTTEGWADGPPSQVANPPGTPVTLDADEADALLVRFGGEELDGAGNVIRTVPKPANHD